MHRLYILVILVVILALPCYAQHTTVTGQVKDGVNQLYRTCTGSANFTGQNTTPGSGPYTLGGSTFQTVVPIFCDGSGRFTISLADNLIITPTPSQWSFALCSAIGVYPGPPICFTTLITITGATQDVTAQLQAASAPLPPYTAILETNGIRNGSQSLLNLVQGSNITIVDDGVGDVTISSSGGGGGGGGGGLPDPGSNGVVYRSGLNTTAAIPNVAVGSAYVSSGVSNMPITQTKPVYDVRDYGLVQDGTTDDTVAMNNLLATIGSNTATVMLTGPTSLGSVIFPANVKLKMEKLGKIKPITSTTPIGGGGFVQGTGTSNVNVLTSSCSVTLTGTVAGNTIIFMEIHHFTNATIPFGSVTDSQAGVYAQLMQQGFNLPDVNSAWSRSNISGGSVTVTVPYKDNFNTPISVANGCIAWEMSGLGPVIAAESSSTGAEQTGTQTTVMSSLGQFGSAANLPTTAGSLLIGFGGQSFINEASCTPGVGYTQPAGSAGYMSGGSQPITGKGFNFCATYKLVSPGGNQNPTQTIPTEVKPTGGWSYAAMSLVPSSSVVDIQGPIDAPAQQICTNCLAGQGTLSFDGNYILDKVFTEWWGASPNASPATNTPAIQAAIIGAFGSNRTNGSGANGFNRELRFMGKYNINGTLLANHMNGFIWSCQERLSCGLVQTATNTTILSTTTGGTYGSFKDFSWTANASQDLSHPLIDLNYTASPSADLVTQFIDFPYNNFIGNSLASIGVRIAAAGGGAQGSNVYFYNDEASGFTEAAYMVGAGSNCTASTLATNAIGIQWYGGDMQFNNAFGIEWFGGGMLKVDGTTFENGVGTSTAGGVQTGYDICGGNTPAGESFTIDNARSESLYMLSGGPYNVTNSFSADSAFNLAPGATPGSGTIIQGSGVAGHGVYQNVTVGGTWTGIATVNTPVIATSGTATTLVNTNQSVAGANTIGHFVKLETVTQAVTGSTGTLLNVPISIGSATGSVTSGTIGASHTMTQSTTGVTCTSVNAPTGTQSLQVEFCSGTADNSHIWTDGTTAGTYTPTSAPVFAPASPTMVITAATGAPDNSHNWTGGTSAAVYVPTAVPVNTSALTPGAWVNWYLTLIGGTGVNQYCIITANTATAFTCAGGWLTDFPDYVTIANPDNTTTYIVEPQWGTQTTNGSVTWTALTKKVGTFAEAKNVFIPGVQVLVQPHVLLRNFQVTRADWNGTVGFFADSTFLYDGIDAVLAGPVAAVSTGIGSLGQGPFYRQKFVRNGITETGYPIQSLRGTSVDHWQGGQIGGGQSYADVYMGTDLNATAGIKKGRFFVENNSSGSPFFWYFNSDSSESLPGSLLWATDNTTNIGAAGANRPAKVFAGTDFVGPIGATTPAAGTFTTATAATVVTTATNGGISATEGTGANVPPGANLDIFWADSTAHRWLMNNNNGASSPFVAGTFASGTVTTAGTIVNAGTCQAQTGITITGALTTDNVVANIGAVLPATWQTGIVLSAHVTAGNTVTVYLCNPSSGAITPAATQVNVRILR